MMSEDGHEHMIPIDPSIQGVQNSSLALDGQTVQQKQDMMHRLQSLEMERARMEREMETLRNAIYSG